MNKTSRVDVGIINFLYIEDQGYKSQKNENHEIETSIIFPAVEYEIQQYGMSNYNLEFRKVVNGNLDYMAALDSPADLEGTEHNLSIWGLVKPINWPVHFDLDLIIFVDAQLQSSSKIKIRDNRIVSWDNVKCDLAQSTLGIIPGVFAYSLYNGIWQNATDRNYDRILKRLELLPTEISQNSMQIIRNWSGKESGTNKNDAGMVKFAYENGLDYRFSIDQALYDQLQRFSSTNKNYNWYLDQGGLLMPEISINLGSPDQEISAPDFDRSYIEPAIQTRLQVGIVPFDNNSGDSDYNWIGFGLEYLLANKFSHISAYKLADRDAVLRFISSDSASVQFNGETWSLDFSIGGSYLVADASLEVDLSYKKAFSGTQIASDHYLTDYDDFFKIVDNAAKRFLYVTGIVLSESEKKLFNRQVTSSMKAFENFCMGYIENAKANRDEEDVIDYFQAAINEDPVFWGAYYNLGTVYYNSKAYTSALTQFNYIIKNFPSFELAYLGRGLTYFQKNEFVKAKADFELYANYIPNDFRAYYYLGRISIQLRQYANAIKYLNKAIELSPNYGRNYFEMGNVYFVTNRFREAISQYQHALKLIPAHLETHKRLGESYYRMHNFSGAIDEFNYVLAVSPYDAETNFMMGVTEYKQALLDDYIDAFLEMYGLIEREETETDKIEHKIEQSRLYREMTKRFFLAQNFRSNFYEATFNLGLTYQERGVIDSALVYFNKTLQIEPNLTKARIVLAKLYENLNEIDRAVEEYKKVVRSNPGYFIGYSNLGPVYNDIDIIAIVLEELETEVKADPHNVASILSLANIYQAQGFNGKAATLYRQVLSLHPENKKAKTMLARINGSD